MKVTVKQLHAGFPALEEFAKKQIPNRRVAYIVSMILDGARAYYEKAESERVDLVKKYGEQITATEVRVIDPDKEKKYRKEWNSIANVEVDFWGHLIGLDQIPAELIPAPSDLSKLLWLFTEETEAPKAAEAKA